jgi:prepilin peptidase CpaA
VSTLLLGLQSICVACICYAMASDFRSLFIPNWIIVVLVSAFAIFAAVRMEPWAILGHVAVAAVVLLFYLAFFLAGWVAGGDVKLIAATALWMGPAKVSLFVLLTALLGALLALALLLVRRYGDLVSRAPLGGTWLLRRVRDLAEQSQCPYGVAIGGAALLSWAGAFQ